MIKNYNNNQGAFLVLLIAAKKNREEISRRAKEKYIKLCKVKYRSLWNTLIKIREMRGLETSWFSFLDGAMHSMILVQFRRYGLMVGRVVTFIT